VKERIARALRIYKEAAAGGGGGGDGVGGALVQVWAPARDGGRRVLATRGQPFVLAPPQCHRLFQYRTVSLTHAFPVGGAGVPGERGLPGRVFDAGAPEWTPNVQYYGTGEYARISYALIYDIQAALALPILDPATGSCVAVVELVTTSPRIRFADEVDKLSKALQVSYSSAPALHLHINEPSWVLQDAKHYCMKCPTTYNSNGHHKPLQESTRSNTARIPFFSEKHDPLSELVLIVYSKCKCRKWR
jgi:hypothetical protein